MRQGLNNTTQPLKKKKKNLIQLTSLAVVQSQRHNSQTWKSETLKCDIISFSLVFFFFFFCGNDIISSVNLKYTFYKFAIMCVNVEANSGFLSCVWINCTAVNQNEWMEDLETKCTNCAFDEFTSAP